MFDWLKQFFTSEDAVVMGTGIGSIVGGIVIAFRAVKKGNPTPAASQAALAAAAMTCRLPDMTPHLEAIDRRIEALEEEARERDDRAEERRQQIAKGVQDILNLTIRLDERTKGKG